MDDFQLYADRCLGSVRVLVEDHTPWFVGDDVADALGYSSPRCAVWKKVPPEDRRVIYPPDQLPKKRVTLVNESGMFQMILTARMPKARAVKEWMTTSVLPAIRLRETFPEAKPPEPRPIPIDQSTQDTMTQLAVDVVRLAEIDSTIAALAEERDLLSKRREDAIQRILGATEKAKEARHD